LSYAKHPQLINKKQSRPTFCCQ